jgi:DNA-directed RNA polymerase subunit L
VSKDKQVNIRVSSEDKKLLEKDAREEDRTIGSLLLWCWKLWRQGKGGNNERSLPKKR